MFSVQTKGAPVPPLTPPTNVPPTQPTGAPQATTPGGAVCAASVGPTPTNARELSALTAKRDELSSQLNNVQGRRNDLANQIRRAVAGQDKTGLENRIAVIDGRLAQIECQLDLTGQQVVAARGIVGTTGSPPPFSNSRGPNSGQITGIMIVFLLAVAMPISISIARAIGRRASRKASAPDPQLLDRLDRMDQGIDAIALEVERISEGQRFVTKLLGDAPQRVAADSELRR